MNDNNRNERVNTGFDLERISAVELVMFGVDCMICGTFIEGVIIPVICDDCRRRLMRMLYPNRREDL